MLDGVAEGIVRWKTIIENFYPDLDAAVKKAEEELEEVKIEDEVTDVICEECGSNMVSQIRSAWKIPGMSGIPGMSEYKAVSGKDWCKMSDVRKRCSNSQNEEGKTLLRL